MKWHLQDGIFDDVIEAQCLVIATGTCYSQTHQCYRHFVVCDEVLMHPETSDHVYPSALSSLQTALLTDFVYHLSTDADALISSADHQV